MRRENMQNERVVREKMSKQIRREKLTNEKKERNWWDRMSKDKEIKEENKWWEI